ncbi:MAG: cytochrome C, partial [bacterium]
DRYPWELPLGFSEEFGAPLGEKPRGLAFELEYPQEMATVYAAEDGYLITARGNPLGNVVRRGSRVILHSATGAELEVPVLKEMEKNDAWVSPGARVAMAEVSKHMDKMECYACHANWAPQCYGCHITVDFSGDKGKTDWIAAGKQHYPDGSTAESEIGARGPTTPGEASESRGYLRWEEPILGINGEGRVTPLMPGCQVVTTVIGRDGQTLAHNRIWRTGDGLRGLDMSPVQPHTMDKKARECESCHSSDKALGYGIDGGRYLQGYQESRRVDLADADGNVLSQKSEVQLWSIPDLPMDWSQIVTREGLQLQTVGSHWELSRPLNDEERRAMERTGACLGCHREMTNDALWQKVSHPATLSDTEHTEHMNTLLREAADLK